MSTEQDPTNEIIDLGFDLSDPSLQLERPVLKEQVAEIRVVSTTRATTKAGAKMIKVQFATTTPLESTTGKTVNPGFPLFDQMMLEDVGKMAPGSWRERPGKLHLAITGDKTGTPNTGAWKDQTVKASIKVRAERHDESTGKTYPESNEIGFYYPKAN